MGRSLMSSIQERQAWEMFEFYPAVSSDGVPRAVKRASKSWLPSTPGRLGYLAAERLMERAGFVPASALFIFINIKICVSRARLTDGSLIEQTAL